MQKPKAWSRRDSFAMLGGALGASLASQSGFAATRPVQRILAFGASNTWGFQPVDPQTRRLHRLPFAQRWAGVAQRALGSRFEIVEDALPGRTAGIDRPQSSASQSLPASAYNGLKELPEALVRNIPLDLVVLQLGTNDLMSDPDISPQTVCDRLIEVCRVISSFKFPVSLAGQPAQIKALVMAPTGIGPMSSNPNWAKAEATRIEALPMLRAAGRQHGFGVFDGAEAVPTPGSDGLHFGPDGHRRLGLLAAASIRTSLT